MGNRIVVGESTVYPKSILSDPQKYFTPEVMQALDEAAAQEFRYGTDLKDYVRTYDSCFY